jgi:hypothetical protein
MGWTHAEFKEYLERPIGQFGQLGSQPLNLRPGVDEEQARLEMTYNMFLIHWEWLKTLMRYKLARPAGGSLLLGKEMWTAVRNDERRLLRAGSIYEVS